MNINIRHYRAFVAVANIGSFGRAADYLHISPSALSQLIKIIEHQFDLRLFERMTGHVQLTAAGISLLPYATRVLAEHNTTALVAEQIKQQKPTIVRIAASSLLSCTIVPHFIAHCTKHIADAQIQLLDVEPSLLHDTIIDGKADLAIGTDRIHESGIGSVRLFSSALHLIVSLDNSLAQRESVTWLDVEREKLIFADRRAIPKISRDINYLYNLKSAIDVSHVTTALALIDCNLGSFVHCTYIAPLLKAYRLKMLPILEPKVMRDIVCYYDSTTPLPPSPARTLKTIQNICNQPPYTTML